MRIELPVWVSDAATDGRQYTCALSRAASYTGAPLECRLTPGRPARLHHRMVSMTHAGPLGDVALVAAYRRGDERAATEIVRRHAPGLACFLRGLGAVPSELDDLVQETFFKAFRALDGWRGESSMRGWLCTIGANLVRDGYRRGKGRVVLSIEDRDLPDNSDPYEELAARETESRLAIGLAELPRLQREVFLLRAQQGCEYDDIARILGTTSGAARVHYHHAVKRLRGLVS
jgi:RNA polymerase sigma-70 factor (ECF subfamily)